MGDICTMKGATAKNVLKSFQKQDLIGLFANFHIWQSPPSFFSSISTTFWQKSKKTFSMNLWAVSLLSQTASDGFDQNWAKSGPLFFLTLEILYALDISIVQCRPNCQFISRVLKKSYEPILLYYIELAQNTKTPLWYIY